MKNHRHVILSFDVDGERAFNSYDKMEKDIYLDDGVPAITKFLKKNGIDATFFIVGKNIQDFPETHELLKDFEIGNHTFSHPRFLTKKSYKEKEVEIKKNHDIITGFFGVAPTMFRAPDYSIDSDIFDILRGMGYIGDSSVIRVLLPFRYFTNYIKHRKLAKQDMEMPLTSFVIPFNGTSVISFGMVYAKIIFNILMMFNRTIVLNLHPRDFVNIDIKETGFMNRDKALETSLEFLNYIKGKCKIQSFRQYHSERNTMKAENGESLR